MSFTNITWPICPECLTTINDANIVSLSDLQNPNGYFRLKECPSCNKKFLMSVKVDLTTEAVPVSDL